MHKFMKYAKIYYVSTWWNLRRKKSVKKKWKLKEYWREPSTLAFLLKISFFEYERNGKFGGKNRILAKLIKLFECIDGNCMSNSKMLNTEKTIMEKQINDVSSTNEAKSCDNVLLQSIFFCSFRRSTNTEVFVFVHAVGKLLRVSSFLCRCVSMRQYFIFRRKKKWSETC